MIGEPVVHTQERGPAQPGEETKIDLVESLEAIAYPNRFKLLTILREPHAIGDIELNATVDHGNPDRVITREGVRHHMKKLRQAGFVETQTSPHTGNMEHKYKVNPRRLYALSEALRNLPKEARSSQRDLHVPMTWETPTRGPTLTVVHGSQIGDTYPLQGTPSSLPRGWIIGRSPNADIRLGWDPYVDDQAAEIQRTEDGFELIDLRAADHRVAVNGMRLDRGEVKELAFGDTISVGRSLLVFQRPRA